MRKRRPPAIVPRLFLTLLFGFFVFVILVITIIIVSIIFYMLVQAELIHIQQHPNLFIQMVVFALVSITTGTLVAIGIAGIPLKPVNRLIDGMNQLANGDYSARLSPGHTKVGADIAKSFNLLAQELSQTEMLRSDFVNNIAHEFKTPIVSIKGFAKLIQKGNLPPEKQEEYLTIIIDEVTRLADLSTNALNLSKIENQAILTDVTRFNLSEQLRNSILLLESKWTSKQILMVPDFGEYYLEANEELLKQVWINLLDNAIKFAPESSTITVFIRQTEEGLSVSITNEGPQIPDENISRLFDKYFQSDTSRAEEGSGIGLSIVSKVVELHGGQVTVDSQTNQTTFTVQFSSYS